jgi:predicted ATP-grasp superfamily ATP-dependent carboligase
LQKPSVLITDGDMKVSLPVLRSLAKKNIETGVAATHKRAMSFFSRYCKNRLLYPSPRENRDLFLKAIRKIVEKTHFDFLFPVGEWTLVPISENREKISPYIKLPIASREAIKKTFDKSLTLKLAMDEDVPTPKSFFINSFQDLRNASKEVSYPAVIKSRWSWVWKGNKASFSRPKYVNSPQELLSAYETVHDDFPFPVIQEYIPGMAYHVGVLCSHSRLRAVCCIKEYRAIPVSGGYATFRETVELDHRMKEFALRLLKALDWHGVAEVEFKLDPRDSVPKFMEINGRFWGSLELAIASGVDFPYLLYRLAMDGDVKAPLEYRIGVKRRWLEGELIYISNILKNVDAYPGVKYPNKLQTLKEFLKVYDGAYDCLYWDDPLPFVSQFLWGDIPRIISNRLLNKIRNHSKE